MARLSTSTGKHGFELARLRKELEQCDMQVFLGAQNRLNDLRDEAIKLVLPIFERLTTEFDKELSNVALHREAELSKMGSHCSRTGGPIAARLGTTRCIPTP